MSKHKILLRLARVKRELANKPQPSEVETKWIGEQEIRDVTLTKDMIEWARKTGKDVQDYAESHNQTAYYSGTLENNITGKKCEVAFWQYAEADWKELAKRYFKLGEFTPYDYIFRGFQLDVKGTSYQRSENLRIYTSQWNARKEKGTLPDLFVGANLITDFIFSCVVRIWGYTTRDEIEKRFEELLKVSPNVKFLDIPYDNLHYPISELLKLKPKVSE